MTVSIIAVDLETREVGIATASFVLGVGAGVPLLMPGVGVAAVQAGSPSAWRPRIHEWLIAGKTPTVICAELTDRQASRSAQVGIVSVSGLTATFDGSELEAEASSVQDLGVCVLANLMESADVPASALAAFSASAGASLRERLLAGLQAADRLGGDVRGRQSAALNVATENADQSGGLDLRVDDSRDPVGELARLSLLAQAQALRRDAVGPDGLYRDIRRLREALSIAPEDQASLGALGLALLRAGHLEEATHLLGRLSVQEPRTAERLTRLVLSGRLDPLSGATVLAALQDQTDI